MLLTTIKDWRGTRDFYGMADLGWMDTELFIIVFVIASLNMLLLVTHCYCFSMGILLNLKEALIQNIS